MPSTTFSTSHICCSAAAVNTSSPRSDSYTMLSACAGSDRAATAASPSPDPPEPPEAALPSPPARVSALASSCAAVRLSNTSLCCELVTVQSKFVPSDMPSVGAPAQPSTSATTQATPMQYTLQGDRTTWRA